MSSAGLLGLGSMTDPAVSISGGRAVKEQPAVSPWCGAVMAGYRVTPSTAMARIDGEDLRNAGNGGVLGCAGVPRWMRCGCSAQAC